jgi:hypothetical protein
VAGLIKTGSILIKDGTFLPTGVQFESEPYTLDWRLVKDLDGHGMDRKIRAARWNFSASPVKLKRLSSVLMMKRWFAGQLSES